MISKLKQRNAKGMTLMEILIVVSLISMVSFAVYKVLANGIRVWQKTRELVIEEDIAIFFGKFKNDLNNTFMMANIKFEGELQRFSFPTIVQTSALPHHKLPKEEFVEQVGKVEYYYDVVNKGIARRKADYGQSQQFSYDPPQILARPIERIQFTYYYITEEGDLFSDQVLEVAPSGVEVAVIFSDKKGKRSLKQYFDIQVGI